MSDLCAACGLCCSGWMFSFATLAEDERTRFATLTAIDGVRLPQPCVFHEGTRCGIYDTRPSGCRAFTCDTLEMLVDGRLTAGAALARAEAAKAAVAAMTAAMRRDGWMTPGEAPAVAWLRLLKAMRQMTSAEDRRRHATLLVDAAVCVKALRDYGGKIDIG